MSLTNQLFYSLTAKEMKKNEEKLKARKEDSPKEEAHMEEKAD